MLKVFAKIFLLMLVLCLRLRGSENPFTILDEKSPNFPMGQQTRRGLLIKVPDHPDMSISLGARLQGSVEAKEGTGAWVGDFYARRIRLEFGANLSRQIFYYMDFRNDQANKDETGEGNTVIGNTYFQVKELFGLPYLNFQGFRGKIDVSRITTASSGQQLYYDRPLIALSAQQYAMPNRRAPNFQLFGSYEGKIRYQVAVGDGVTSSSFFDARGVAAISITRQDPMFGGKIVLSPIPGWEEKDRTMTYFGRGHHAAIGVGYFRNNAILFTPKTGADVTRTDRSLLNIESSFAWGPLFLCAEYFKFNGMIENYNASTVNPGSSDGWYVTGEYVLPDFYYLAPFFKYERWDRFREAAGYFVESYAAGANLYLMGNSFRAGLVGQRDHLEANVGGRTETVVKMISQVHF